MSFFSFKNKRFFLILLGVIVLLVVSLGLIWYNSSSRVEEVMAFIFTPFKNFSKAN
jgi:hypothetical protein